MRRQLEGGGESRAEGELEGEEEGKVEGEVEGKVEGETEGGDVDRLPGVMMASRHFSRAATRKKKKK